mmetsp:Transcript_35334/g.88815  ORF Transcript_35334/g.88815 Transcript_35334/m.88815 type:complete len:214 (+) Transcript_35334:399-1040(+)
MRFSVPRCAAPALCSPRRHWRAVVSQHAGPTPPLPRRRASFSSVASTVRISRAPRRLMRSPPHADCMRSVRPNARVLASRTASTPSRWLPVRCGSVAGSLPRWVQTPPTWAPSMWRCSPTNVSWIWPQCTRCWRVSVRTAFVQRSSALRIWSASSRPTALSRLRHTRYVNVPPAARTADTLTCSWRWAAVACWTPAKRPCFWPPIRPTTFWTT